ncbi:MAG: acetoin utilization protein AcuC, partial [Stackebrandtia sp.]
PAAWRRLAKARRPQDDPPETMTDGADVAYRPWQPGAEQDDVDRAVLAVRQAVFPLHGLDPRDHRG